MPKDIFNADPSTLNDAEHAQLSAAWDAALAAADAGEWKPDPANPRTLSPAAQAELERSHVRLPYTRIES